MVKRGFYVVSWLYLGFLLATIFAVLFQVALFGLAWNNAKGLLVFTALFQIIGLWLGYRAGVYFWKQLYQKNGKLKKAVIKRWKHRRYAW